jgi:TrmH family RNA methyltransferase
VLEGPTLVGEALAAGLAVREVFVDAEHLAPTGASRWPWLDAAPTGLVRSVAPGVLGRVLDTATPPPVAALVDLPVLSLDAVLAPRGAPAFVMVLAGVADPGNVGTIVRSAAAAGASVVALDGTADPFNPKSVRASAGAVLRTPLAETTPEVLLPALAAAGVPLWVADAAGGEAPERVPATGPVAVVVGNEAHGVPPAIADAATGRLHLPMVGDTESLNAAMAASILLFEVARQRRGRRTDGRAPEATA